MDTKKTIREILESVKAGTLSVDGAEAILDRLTKPETIVKHVHESGGGDVGCVY